MGSRHVALPRSYHDQPTLRCHRRSADVVVLPYDSREQVTSGVLIEAVGRRSPSWPRRFPHAVELLTGGAGLVVPQRDSGGDGRGPAPILTEPGLAARMAAASRSLGRGLRWPAVAARYDALGEGLVAERARSVA